MLRLTACILLALLMIGHAGAGSRGTGDFDYYVLALSWTPSWCTLTGDARKESQCDEGREFGFTLHGLWPQFETGWPSFCPTTERAPSRRMTREMADIMGSDGLAWHQWDKHGRCTGLSAADYYETARTAYERIVRPEVFRRLLKAVDLPARVVEDAFLQSNPALSADMITVTCKRGYFQEVRICLDKSLNPRICGADVLRDCDQRVTLPALR